MTKVVLEIPQAVQAALRLPPGEIQQELRKELALYQRQVLSLGKAQELAQVTRWEFEELLGRRKVPRHYTAEDLQEDLQYANGRQ